MIYEGRKEKQNSVCHNQKRPSQEGIIRAHFWMKNEVERTCRPNSQHSPSTECVPSLARAGLSIYSFTYPSQHHQQVDVLGSARLNNLPVVKPFVNCRAVFELRPPKLCYSLRSVKIPNLTYSSGRKGENKFMCQSMKPTLVSSSRSPFSSPPGLTATLHFQPTSQLGVAMSCEWRCNRSRPAFSPKRSPSSIFQHSLLHLLPVSRLQETEGSEAGRATRWKILDS